MKSFQQNVTENSYFRQEELVFADCDCHLRARISTLLSKAASFAGYDYDARGLTHERLLEMGNVFLLSRVAMRIHRSPLAQEVLNITTWEKQIKGPHMQRVYEITDAAGEVCVSMESDWILVDPQTRRILRPETFTAKKMGHCPKEIDCPETRRLPPIREGGEVWGRHRVAWSDLDGNGHLYSGRYGDIIWDALPREFQEEMPREFFMNYNHEVTLGQELELLGIREDGGFRMEGKGPNGISFTCKALY